MSEPPGLSLKQLGVWAPNGLDCPEGGLHHVPGASVMRAAARAPAEGGVLITCLKCQQDVLLEPLPMTLED